MALPAILAAIARPVFEKAVKAAWGSPAVRSRITLMLGGLSARLGERASWRALVDAVKDDPISFTLLMHELIQMGSDWADELMELLGPLLSSDEGAKAAWDRVSNSRRPPDSVKSTGLDYDEMVAPLTDELQLLRRVCAREFGGDTQRLLDFVRFSEMDKDTIETLLKLKGFGRGSF